MKLENLKVGMKVRGGIMCSDNEVRTVIAIQPRGYIDWEEGVEVINDKGYKNWVYFKFLKPFNNNIRRVE